MDKLSPWWSCDAVLFMFGWRMNTEAVWSQFTAARGVGVEVDVVGQRKVCVVARRGSLIDLQMVLGGIASRGWLSGEYAGHSSWSGASG